MNALKHNKRHFVIISAYIPKLTFNPDGLSFFSNLISSISSSLGDIQHTADSSGSWSNGIALGSLGEGRGVGIGVGKGVGSGVGSSRIGERHLLILLGTSRSIDGGCRPDDKDLWALSWSITCKEKEKDSFQEMDYRFLLYFRTLRFKGFLSLNVVYKKFKLRHILS